MKSKINNENKRDRRIKDTSIHNSEMKVRKRWKNPHHTESEDSDNEVSLWMGRNMSHSTHQPHHSKANKRKQQQDPHSKSSEYDATAAGKVNTSTTKHAKLKKKEDQCFSQHEPYE